MNRLLSLRAIEFYANFIYSRNCYNNLTLCEINYAIHSVTVIWCLPAVLIPKGWVVVTAFGNLLFYAPLNYCTAIFIFPILCTICKIMIKFFWKNFLNCYNFLKKIVKQLTYANFEKFMELNDFARIKFFIA